MPAEKSEQGNNAIRNELQGKTNKQKTAICRKS